MTKKSLPLKYVPKTLSPSDKKKQEKSIREGKDRPKVNYKSKRSTWAVKFEKKYGVKISDTDFIDKNIISKKGQDEIVSKGMKAYYTSGSRPNQTPFSWGLARLASVIMGGNARVVDMKIWKKYKR